MASVNNFFLLTPFLLLHFSFSSSSRSLLDNLNPSIDEVCRRQENSDFCYKQLTGVLGSEVADMTGLGYITLNLTENHITTTTTHINDLLRKESSNNTRRIFTICLDVYGQALASAKVATGDLTSKDYAKMRADAVKVGVDAQACEGEFTSAKIPSPLSEENKNTGYFSLMAVTISEFIPR